MSKIDHPITDELAALDSVKGVNVTRAELAETKRVSAALREDSRLARVRARRIREQVLNGGFKDV